jgi:hypothetical protein
MALRFAAILGSRKNHSVWANMERRHARYCWGAYKSPVVLGEAEYTTTHQLTQHNLPKKQCAAYY